MCVYIYTYTYTYMYTNNVTSIVSVNMGYRIVIDSYNIVFISLSYV